LGPIQNNENSSSDKEVIVMSIRTLRGDIDGGARKSIFQFEGLDVKSLSRAWKVKDVFICQSQSNPVTTGANGCILHTDDQTKTRFQLIDNQVIGAAGWSAAAGRFIVLDPNHIIVEHLFLTNLDSQVLNYLVILEEIKINKTGNIIYRLKERAQTTIEE